MSEERVQPRTGTRHDVVMVNRQAIEVTGVLDVESFDSREFVLHTAFGALGIQGEGLHIKTLTLDKGVVSIEGSISQIAYFDDANSPGGRTKGLIGRLFR